MDTITTIINWFGLIYVGIPIVALIILVFYLAFGGKISGEHLDKIIQFSKWYIVSVAIVFSAKVVESSFTERETGIKEMQVYDKYVATILEADNIEARWKLAEYFSTVTPTDRLRERWDAYKDIIKPDYEEFKKLEREENELLSQDSLTPEQQNKLNNLQLQKSSFERKLVDQNVGRWVVVFATDTGLEPSQYELNKLIKAGIDDPRIYLRNNYFITVSKIFPTKTEALNYLQTNKSKIRSDSYVVNLDKWCAEASFNGEYYDCN